MNRRRAGLTLSLVALLAAPAAAKEGVRAKATTPVNLGAPAHTALRVTWRLVDRQGHPFGARDIYLRASRCRGGAPVRVRATARGGGRYSATLTVPRGGLRRLTVGIEGWRITPGGRRTRADMVFAFDPPLSRRCPR